MIVTVKKYLFIGLREEIDAFFERAQDQGFLEFLSISGKKEVQTPQEIENLIKALKILREQPVKKAYGWSSDLALAQRIAQQIVSLKAEIEKFYEEKRLLEAEISRVGIFGDFSMDDIDYIEREGRCKIQFFCMKTTKSHKAAFLEELFYIGTEYDLDYFLTLNPTPQTYPGMIEMRIDRPLGDLHHQLSFVREALHQLEAELKGFAGHIEFLQHMLVEELNLHSLNTAKKEVRFPLNETLFVVEAWVPENKITALFRLIEGLTLHAEEIAPEERDHLPTYLENHGIGKIGEDLIKIYDIPATTDKDPSRWVLFAFVLFFAMIVADGGYGLIYLGLALYLKYKFPDLKQQGKRLLRLFSILATACILWGLLTSSFFGLRIDSKSFFGRFSLVGYLTEKKADYHLTHRDDIHTAWVGKRPELQSATSGGELIEKAVTFKGEAIEYEMFTEFSRNILLEISLMIGVIHVILGLMRYLKRHWAGLGWLLFIIGGYLYFPSILNATSIVHILHWVDKEVAFQIGLQLLWLGIGLAMTLAFIQKKWGGFGEAATVVQIFADILSYLRLYALGLAGSIMAETFNGIGEYVGLVAGVVAIIAGHGVNILLGVMGGVIHGLRLNFLEWYHYCFDGGGRLMKPLVKLK
jgi:V/A-type H+/Na+-transporting ATPase subunit I